MADAKDLMIVQYESAQGVVKLDIPTVINYLAHGNTKLSEQEAILFIQLCKYQKLNPFVGEAYPIKFGNDFQMVVGYETYKRRAEENPEYNGRKSGIVVTRKTADGVAVHLKEGTCKYPMEELIGGWCRVIRTRADGRSFDTYKEVSLEEYQKLKDGKPMANWATKPATMIEKVAVSQALRAAFPTDFAGMYTPEELAPDGSASVPPGQSPNVVIKDGADIINDAPYIIDGDKPKEQDRPITQDERKAMFSLAQEGLGEEPGKALIKKLMNDSGIKHTNGMMKSVYDGFIKAINETIDASKAAADESPEFEPDDEPADECSELE